MVTLYSWGTPNGHEVSIMLEASGLRYPAKPVDIGAGNQFDPSFLALNPNNRIPVWVDDEGPNGALEVQLEGRPWRAADLHMIADIAARPAVQRGLKVPA